MSAAFELMVRGGRIVTPGGLARADLGICEGRFAAVAPELSGRAGETVDASGCVVFPGIIDAHVHFNEPGRTDWEGFSSGSAALAAGGGTCFFDMPLNSLPPTLDAESFALKRAAGERGSLLDFALWGGLVPGKIDRLAELHASGAVGFKAFMCDSGAPEFPASDAATLRSGMRVAAGLGLPVAVHAEDQALASRFTRAARERGSDVAAWLESRPVAVELEAIRIALDLAGETRCPLHLVHVSSPEGVALADAAKARGVDVTVETCPHYLLLTRDDVLRLGPPAKCAPLLRSEAGRMGLWEALESRRIDTIGSDHSPAPPALKESGDFFQVWGGISGCQHGFPLVLSAAIARRGEDALPSLAPSLAACAARRFGLQDRKGAIATGLDADFTVLDLRSERPLANAELLYRHRQGPYDGRRCRARILRTVARGRTVVRDGAVVAGPGTAQFLRPLPRSTSSHA